MAYSATFKHNLLLRMCVRVIQLLDNVNEGVTIGQANVRDRHSNGAIKQRQNFLKLYFFRLVEGAILVCKEMRAHHATETG